MSTDSLATAIYQRDCWITQARQLEREIARLRGELNHERWQKMKEGVSYHESAYGIQPEQQSDVVTRMLYEYMGIEDCREAMTAASRMLLDEARTQIMRSLDERFDLPRDCSRNIADEVIARILPESKPDAAVAAQNKQLRAAHYLSTACWHEQHEQCRKECKFCAVKCHCECHTLACLLPKDAAVEAVQKHLKWVGSVYAEDADPVAIVAAVDKARGR